MQVERRKNTASRKKSQRNSESTRVLESRWLRVNRFNIAEDTHDSSKRVRQNWWIASLTLSLFFSHDPIHHRAKNGRPCSLSLASGDSDGSPCANRRCPSRFHLWIGTVTSLTRRSRLFVEKSVATTKNKRNQKKGGGAAENEATELFGHSRRPTSTSQVVVTLPAG